MKKKIEKELEKLKSMKNNESSYFQRKKNERRSIKRK